MHGISAKLIHIQLSTNQTKYACDTPNAWLPVENSLMEESRTLGIKTSLNHDLGSTQPDNFVEIFSHEFVSSHSFQNDG